MGFNTTCFIRKNNEVLRKSLLRMGYHEINVSEKDDVYKNLRTGTDLMGRICRYMQWRSEKYNSCIDCGVNEDLFLAIAALRDDDISLNDKINEINKKYGTKIEFRR